MSIKIIGGPRDEFTKSKELIPLQEMHQGKAVPNPCSICLNELNQRSLRLACDHLFDEHCLKNWIDTCIGNKQRVFCPLCKATIHFTKPTSFWFNIQASFFQNDDLSLLTFCLPP